MSTDKWVVEKKILAVETLIFSVTASVGVRKIESGRESLQEISVRFQTYHSVDFSCMLSIS
jgi:hypothetical protein